MTALRLYSPPLVLAAWAALAAVSGEALTVLGVLLLVAAVGAHVVEWRRRHAG